MTEQNNDELKNISTAPPTTSSSEGIDKKYLIIAIIVTIVILGLIIVATIYLINPDNSTTTEQIRDVFIIFMALESLIIGVALVILIVQLSTLINLLQNEVRPIINATNETVNTLKGTARFMSDNLTEPVIKINQFAAMIKRLLNPKGK